MDLNPDLLERLAAYHPSRPAVHWQGRWVTFGELAQRARRAAALLAALGVRPGDRVALLAHNHIAFLDLLFATPLAGFVLAPLNHRLALAELRELMAYLQPRLLLHGPGLDSLAGQLGAPGGPVEGLGGVAGPTPRHVASAEEAALLLFTGGTTGLPKAAMISHRQLVVNSVNTVFAWGLRQDDSCIVATPMFHAAVNALATPLLHLGGSVIVQERFDPGEYLELVAAHRPTLLFLVPTMFQAVADHPLFARTDLSSVRWAISGGAACPTPVRDAFRARGVRFKQGYGLTEAGVNCFAIDLDEADAHPDSVGRPMPHLRARIAGPDGRAAEPGEVGELLLSGPVVMSGYLDRPAETAAVFQTDPSGRLWLRTGDLARRDEAGRYYIVGRSKEMFISGGENVYPAEVERALHDHPAVAEACVVGVPDPKWGEVGLAAVVLRAGVRAGADELRGFLKDRLAGYKVPKRWRFLESLPKSAAGKILKREVAALEGSAGAER